MVKTEETQVQKENLSKKRKKDKVVRSAKECTYLAVFVAVVIATQVVLSVLPGIELVTVLFVSFSFVMGGKRGIIAAIAFSLLRQFVFGIYPKVLVLYLIYYPLLAFCFGGLGKILRHTKGLIIVVVVACVCTVFFTMLDNILTPLWLGYSARDAGLYFFASLPFMFPQVICTAVSVAMLFLPLHKVFSMIKRQ